MSNSWVSVAGNQNKSICPSFIPDKSVLRQNQITCSLYSVNVWCNLFVQCYFMLSPFGIRCLRIRSAVSCALYCRMDTHQDTLRDMHYDSDSLYRNNWYWTKLQLCTWSNMLCRAVLFTEEESRLDGERGQDCSCCAWREMASVCVALWRPR